MVDNVSVLGLDLETGPLERGTLSLDRLQGSMAAALGATSGLERAFGAAGRQLAVLAAGYLSLRAAVGTFNALADSAANFEFQMAQVRAASQASGAELRALSVQARELGLQFGVGARAAANAQEILVKAGVSVEDALDGATRASLLLARATGSGIEEAANVAVGALQIFGIEAREIDRVITGASGVINETRLSLQDYQLALAQGAAAAASAGLSFEDFNAAIAASAGAFNSGSDQGTSLKNAIAALAAPTDEARERLQSLGIEAFDAGGNLKSIDAIIQELQDGLGGLSTQQQFDALDTIFGRDGARVVIALLDQGAEGVRRFRDELIPLSDAQAQADARTEGFIGQVAKLRSEFEDLGVEIGENGLNEALTRIATAATAAIGRIRDGVDSGGEIGAFDAIADGAVGLIENFDLLADAAGGVAAALAVAFAANTAASIGAAVTQAIALERALGAATTATAALGAASKAAQAALLGINPVTAGIALAAGAIGLATTGLLQYRREIGQVVGSSQRLTIEHDALNTTLAETEAKLRFLENGDAGYVKLAQSVNELRAATAQANAELDRQAEKLQRVVAIDAQSSLQVFARTGFRPAPSREARDAQRELDRQALVRSGQISNPFASQPLDEQRRARERDLSGLDQSISAATRGGAFELEALQRSQKLLVDRALLYEQIGREAAGVGATQEQIAQAARDAALADARVLLSKEAQRDALTKQVNQTSQLAEESERVADALREQSAARTDLLRAAAGEAAGAAQGAAQLEGFRAAEDLLSQFPELYASMAREALGARASVEALSAAQQRLAREDAATLQQRASETAFFGRRNEAQRELADLGSENLRIQDALTRGLDPQVELHARIREIVGDTNGLLDEDIERRVSIATEIANAEQAQRRLNQALRNAPETLDTASITEQLRGLSLSVLPPGERERQEGLEQVAFARGLLRTLEDRGFSGEQIEELLGRSAENFVRDIEVAAGLIRDAGRDLAEGLGFALDGFLARFLQTGRADFGQLFGDVRGEIGRAFSQGVRGIDFGEALGGIGKAFEGFSDDFSEAFNGVFRGGRSTADAFGSLGSAAGTLAAGAGAGQFGFGLARSVGLGDGRAGQIGGGVGGAVGGALGLIGGPVLGAVGAAIGSFLGGALGGLFSRRSNEGAGLDLSRLGNFGPVLGKSATEETSSAVQDAAQRIAQGQDLLRQLGADLDSTVRGLVLGTRDTSQFRIEGSTRNEVLRSQSIGDPQELSSAALREVLRDATFANQTIGDLSAALLGTTASFEDIVEVLDIATQAVGDGSELLTDYERRVRDLNRTFDDLLADTGRGNAEVTAALGATRDAALTRLRDDFGKGIERALLEATSPAAAQFEQLIEGITTRIRDATAVGYDLENVLALNTAELSNFIASGAESVEAFQQLASVFDDLRARAAAAGQDTASLDRAFAEAQVQVVEGFNRAIAEELTRAGNETLGDLNDLLRASQARIESARAIGADVGATERLASLRLQRFFEGLNEEQLRGLGDYLGLVEAATGRTTLALVQLRSELETQIAGVDATRDRLGQDRDAFRSGGQAALDTRQGLLDRFSAASPQAALDELRGRLDTLAADARAGNASALTALPQVAQAIVERSRALNGSSNTFFRDLDGVNRVLGEVGDAALAQASEFEQQLTRLDTQVTLLEQIRDLLNEDDLAPFALSDALAELDARLFPQVSALLGNLVAAGAAETAAQPSVAEIQAAALAALNGTAPPPPSAFAPPVPFPAPAPPPVAAAALPPPAAAAAAAQSVALSEDALAALEVLIEQNAALIAQNTKAVDLLQKILRENQTVTALQTQAQASPTVRAAA